MSEEIKLQIILKMLELFEKDKISDYDFKVVFNEIKDRLSF